VKGKPFAILTGKGNRAQVMMCSPEAERQQVFAGMKLSEAKAACADLIWKDHDAKLYARAQQDLCRGMIACSPKVSSVEPGTFVLDAAGLNYLGGEKRFCLKVQKLAASAGYSDVHIGLADSTFAAIVASTFKRQRHFIVEQGQDQPFLAPLSIRHLPLSVDMLESLHELGIRTMGQMVSLSRQSLIERFGKEGVAAFELASGIDVRRPSLPPAEKEFKCFVDLGSPLELLNEIQFVLKSMIDRLAQEIKQESLWAEELALSFYNDDEPFDQRPIKLLRPSNHAKFLLEVMKLSLEATPLQREVTGIGLSVSRFSRETWHQLDLDKNKQPEEQSEQQVLSVTLMLQRFMSRLGEESVVKSIANDQHIPEHAAAWLPVAGSPSVMPVVPVNITFASAYAAPTGLASGLALRKLAAPQPVLVEFHGEQPDAVAFEGRWYRIQSVTTPERLSGLWWDQPVRRSYYVALMQPKGDRRPEDRHAEERRLSAGSNDTQQSLLVLLVNDHEKGGWFINGTFD
jgi:nucleotidyltransferase/DNA polymerase involved in DNA repair